MATDQHNPRADVVTSDIAHRTSHIGYRPWLHRYACCFVVATFGLIMLGGTVTSRGVGMAVPDWPTTYEYNMFLFPPSLWKGGVFWEHTHRLAGAAIGLMTIIIAVWLFATQRQRRWLRWLGVATLGLVIVQGVMGGLRVTEIDYRWGIVHGITAQVFLALTVVIAAATGRWWLQQTAGPKADRASAPQPTLNVKTTLSTPRRLAVALLAVLFVQLALGAAMRHSGAGLAVPDFPTSYGGLVPPLSQPAIDDAHTEMVPWEEVGGADPAALQHPSVLQVTVHFAHRVGALAVTLAVTALLISVVRRREQLAAGILWPACAVGGLLIVQALLGASVIWTRRHPEVATAHQATGALLLATATLFTLRAYVSKTAYQTSEVREPRRKIRPTARGLKMEPAGA